MLAVVRVGVRLVTRSHRWRMYLATAAGQAVVAALFLTTGIVDFTAKNVAIMAVIAWSACVGVSMIMRGAGTAQR